MKTVDKQTRDASVIAMWREMKADPRNTYLRATPAMVKIAAEIGVSYPTVRAILIKSGEYAG